MNDMSEHVNDFFERYATALIERDAKAMAEMYSVPSLIVFPGNVMVVSDAAQTEAFFASAWGQYEGVASVTRQTTIMAEAPDSVWADVTWSYSGQPQERFCYQLINLDGRYQIVVLTPLALP